MRLIFQNPDFGKKDKNVERKGKKEIRLTDTYIVHYNSESSIIPMHLIGFHENPLQKSQSFNITP